MEECSRAPAPACAWERQTRERPAEGRCRRFEGRAFWSSFVPAESKTHCGTDDQICKLDRMERLDLGSAHPLEIIDGNVGYRVSARDHRQGDGGSERKSGRQN